jgi:hypothetical protein
MVWKLVGEDSIYAGVELRAGCRMPSHLVKTRISLNSSDV